MAEPQQARRRALSDALHTDEWMRVRNGAGKLRDALGESELAKRLVGQFVQRTMQVLLTTGDISHPLISNLKPSADYAAFLNDLNVLLQNDGRFHNIRWCNPNEIFGKGAGSPTPLG
jgi:hypothetical protein